MSKKNAEKDVMTSHKEVLLLVDSIAHEKNVSKELVFKALEESIAFAVKKTLKGSPSVRVEIDRDTGVYQAFRHWTVVKEWDESYSDDTHLMTVDLEDHHPKNSLEFEEEVTVDLGRNSAKLIKQSILQKLKEVEQLTGLEDLGVNDELHWGVIKGFAKGNALLEIGRVEAVLPRSETLFQDRLMVNNRVLVAIKSVEKIGQKTVVTATRASDEFMNLLIQREIGVIHRGDVEVVKLARNPGFRTKILVRSSGLHDYSRGQDDSRTEAVGQVKGKRGINLTGLTKETGEYIDVYPWFDSIGDQIVAIFEKVNVVLLNIEEGVSAQVVLENESEIQKVLGNRGSNLDLISKLLGIKMEVLTQEEYDKQSETEKLSNEALYETLIKDLDIDRDLAESLVDLGVTSLAHFEIEECAEAIEDELGLDQETISELKKRAQEAMAKHHDEKTAQALLSLKAVEGIEEDEMHSLIHHQIFSWDELADLSTDELMDLNIFKKERAQELISSARNNW